MPMSSLANKVTPLSEASPAPLILASASASRAAVLRQAGLEALAEPAHVDEAAVKESLKAEGATAAAVAETLAALKAQKISGRHGGVLVIGADQHRVAEV